MCIRLLLAAGIIAGIGGVVPNAMAACVPSTRDIGFADGAARIKNYTCQIEGAAAPQVQVEYDRLSEPLAAIVVNGVSDPDLGHAIGDFITAESDVYVETKSLFDNYSTKQVTPVCYRFAISVGPGGVSYIGNGMSQGPCGEHRVLQYLTFPDDEVPASLTLLLPDDQYIVRTSDHWPPGWNFFYYNCAAKSIIACTILWRSGRDSDMVDYQDRVRQYESRLGLPDSGARGDASAPAWTRTAHRMIALIQHLTHGGWPENFLMVTGMAPSVGVGMEFDLRVRQLVLEVALIKNVSSEPVTIDGLHGTVDNSPTLRSMPLPAPDNADQPLPLQRMDLEPGQTLLVPTKILLVPAGGADEIFYRGTTAVSIDKAVADQVFKVISSSPPGTVFRENYAGSAQPETKLSESFGAPTVPVLPVFEYGPAIDLRGMTLNGAPLVFQGFATNFFHVVANDHHHTSYMK